MMADAAVSASVLAATNADADSNDATTTATIAAGSERHLLLRGRYFSSQVHTCFKIG